MRNKLRMKNRKKSRKNVVKNRLGGLVVMAGTRKLMGTLDSQWAFYDESVDPAVSQFRGPLIYVFWHEYIPMLFYVRGHCNIAILVSHHRDAQWLSEAARHMGFETVRGSTQRGGGAAVREMFRKINHTNLAITPDGPRGPRRQLATGPIYLSSKLKTPLVAVGIGYDRPWRLHTWDRFAVPRPFSRARTISSPRIQIPPDLNRAGIEAYRRRVENLLNRLTTEAECWAESGTRKIEQKRLYPRPAYSHRLAG